MSMSDFYSDWKLARYQQIRNLFKKGVSKDDLEKRFGKQNVSNALGKSMVYQ
jgi:hypothetical protein